VTTDLTYEPGAAYSKAAALVDKGEYEAALALYPHMHKTDPGVLENRIARREQKLAEAKQR